jgi:hypothetical protein
MYNLYKKSEIKQTKMETKNQYLEQAEIKVKNLLSDLYEMETSNLKKIGKAKEKLKEKESELKFRNEKIKKLQVELQKKFDLLKTTEKAEWEKAKIDFEAILAEIEGDKESFIRKAEEMLDEWGARVQEYEQKIEQGAVEAKDDLVKRINDLKISREELQQKLETVKNDSSGKWRDMKHWLIERTNIFRDFIADKIHT